MMSRFVLHRTLWLKDAEWAKRRGRGPDVMNGALVAIWNYEVHLRMEWEPTNNRTVDS